MNQYNILKSLPIQGLEPRQFLRHCFGIADNSAERLLEEETDSQYRKKCISVLSCIFNIERATVRNWGTDLNFDGMPNYCKIGRILYTRGWNQFKNNRKYSQGRIYPTNS